jgi:uncharacterized lipoprotein YddW (UPF0748 family)
MKNINHFLSKITQRCQLFFPLSLLMLALPFLSCIRGSGTTLLHNNDSTLFSGVWVTNVASTILDSRQNIQNCVRICKEAGIRHIFMVTYNNARTTYPSEIMRQRIGVSIQEKFAGRDPLQEMIEEAHSAGIKVHAWFEYGFSSSYSANGGPLIAANPQWAAKDVNGNLVVKNGFDWLNAFDPEVQQFLLSLLKEVVGRYDVDGVQGDDRLPALPSTAGYDPYTVSLYQQENGGVLPPKDHMEPSWIDWRTKKLNAFMKEMYFTIKKMKPGIFFSSSPSPYPWGKEQYLQDWPTWVDSNWVDAVIPQCYRYDISAYQMLLTQQKSFHRNTNIPLYPGMLLRIGSYTASESFLTQMVESNRSNGYKGEVFFFYEGVPLRSNWFTNNYPQIK